MGSCVGRNKSSSTRHKTINEYKNLNDETTCTTRIEQLSPRSFANEETSYYPSNDEKTKNINSNLPLDTVNLLNGWNNLLKIEDENVREIKIYISNNCLDKSCFNLLDGKIFKSLRQYCAQYDYDLDIIDLGFIFDSIIYNNHKYNHRYLIKHLTQNTFNEKNSTKCIFIVLFFNNIDCTQLLPDLLYDDDYNEIISNLSNQNSDDFMNLFNELYTRESSNHEYKLNINRNIEKLNELVEYLKRNLSENLFNKYCRPLIEDEIDMAIKYLNETSLLWYHHNPSSIILEPTSSIVNNIINKLQTHVVTDNYAESNLNEFLRLRCGKLVDEIIAKSTKTHKIVPRIDKNLSYELCKQWELWNVFCQNSSPQMQQILESIEEKYLLSSKSCAFTIYEQKDITHSFDNNYLSILCTALVNRLNVNNENTVICRYCGHTIASSNAFTLVQSVVHQFTYLFDIHESTSFQTISSLLKNLVKLFDYEYNVKRECNQKKIILIIDRIDRIYGKFTSEFESDEDFKLVFECFDKLLKRYANKIHVIVTFSTASTRRNRLFEFIESNVDHEHKTTNLIDISSLKKSSQPQSNRISSNKQLRFKDTIKSSFVELKETFNGSMIIDYIFDYLIRTRYGLIESEILDLIYILINKIQLNHNSSSTNVTKSAWHFTHDKTSIYASLVVWYSIKYSLHTKIKFISSYVHHGQQYFKISDTYYKRCLKNCILHKDSSIKKVHLKLLNDYFAIRQENQLGTNVKIFDHEHEYRLFKRSQFLIINSSLFKHRCYLESPVHFINYHRQNNTDSNAIAIDYSKTYLINFNWFYAKLSAINEIWLIMQDFDLFRVYFKQHSKTDIENVLDEVMNFEMYLINNLYYINQSFNLSLFLRNYKQPLNEQFHHDLKQVILSQKQETLHFYPLKIKKKLSIINELIPLNDTVTNTKSNLTYACFIKNLENYIVSLSRVQKEIRIWNSQTLSVVRTIKLNKVPKDVRFIDSYRCVLLLDRNLHLFDLNKCEHLVDLQTTMNIHMPFYELPDDESIVFLDRNRLTVTLMRLPQSKLEFQQQNSDLHLNTSKRYHFKVGEDRSINSLKISKNGRIMVCGDDKQKPFPLIVWNLHEQKLIYDFRQQKHEFITSIQSVGSSGHYLVCATCEEDGKYHNFLSVYDLNSGIFYTSLKEVCSFVCVEISESHNVIVGSLENANIVIYDISSKEKKHTLKSSKFPCTKIKVIESTHQFLTYDIKGFDWTIRLWDIERGQLLASYTCQSMITSCDINTKGDTCVVTLHDYNDILLLKLYNSEKLLRTLATEGKKSSSTSTTSVDGSVPIYGDQSLIGKCLEITI